MKRLTDRQKQILNYITSYIDDNGYPPTIREIGSAMSIHSTNGVNDHLKALARKGYLVRNGLKSRAMRPTSPNGRNDNSRMVEEPEIVNVPVMGRVAAGQPILAVEEELDNIKIDRMILGSNHAVFALRITGNSMIDDKIFDGDFIFVKKTPVAERGSIVVALIDGEATCKRYFPEPELGRVRFQPANENMQPIYVEAREFRQSMIIGQVVGVYRCL